MYFLQVYVPCGNWKHDLRNCDKQVIVEKEVEAVWNVPTIAIYSKHYLYILFRNTGLELRNDRKTCVEPDAFLVYSRKNIIGRISIENENNDAVLPIKELKEVRCVLVIGLFLLFFQNNNILHT